MNCRLALCLVGALLVGCVSANDDDSGGPGDAGALTLTAVTFNTGTTDGLPHDTAPDDGYGSEEAAVSDAWYGNGLAWLDVVQDTAAFFAGTPVDLVAFQEIFSSGDCATIPASEHPGFVCEGWQAGDPTVAETVVGSGWQVACHQGKPDKCLAVRRSAGSFAGCEDDLCLDFLDGGTVAGCGGGSRVGRGVLDLVDGSTLTVVNVHGSSGLSDDDKACRLAQFEQVFADLGDGSPAASGARNLVLGDLNTDPGRFLGSDPSAAYFADAAAASGLSFHTEVGPQASPTYGGLVNIDHVLSDAFEGGCWSSGVAGRPEVTPITYFDHKATVCELTATGER